MRHTASFHSHPEIPDMYSLPPERSIRSWIKCHIQRLMGLSLIATSIICAVALATWSVNDPSLSYATTALAQNALGYAGAMIADLFMQFLGLGSLTLLLIMAGLGWQLWRLRSLAPLKRRMLIILLAVIFTSGAFSALPLTQNWPLPIGLGGVIGDVLIWLPLATLGSYIPSVISLIIALSFCITGALLFIIALWTYPLHQTNNTKEAPFPPKDIETVLEEEDTTSFGWLSLGALTHIILSTKATLSRMGRYITKRWNAQKHVQQNTNNTLSPDQWGDGEWASYEEQHTDFHEGNVPLHNCLAPIPPKTQNTKDNRVLMPKANSKPSQRAKQEAQASLLPNDEYELPPLHLLSTPDHASKEQYINSDALEQNARLLEGVLEDFGVRGEIIQVRPGPVVTLYELEPAPGIKSARVIGLADDIARSMSAISARVAVIPGRNAIGIELPNARRETVYFRELIDARDFEKTKAKLALCLGKTIGGEAVIADLSKMPHLLVAGTTGSGKSVSINTMILSLLYRMTPEECRMIMIDPKMLELSIYDGIPHLLSPVVTDPKKAVVALKWTVREMEERYKKMSKLGVRNIDGFNNRIAQAHKKQETITRTVQTGFDHETGEAIYEQEELHFEPMPYIVVIIDEMADLMMVAGKDIEGTVQRLAQMARAAGIHVIMATQRPSVDVITGTIKANFPTRISFQVTSKIDSRTILGEQGAEQLLGMGDMLYMAGGGRIQRVHGPFVSDDEVEEVVAHLKNQGIPEYLEAITDENDLDLTNSYVGMTETSDDDTDDLYTQAVAIVLRDNKASTSYVQRRLSIGYNRAATIIERMEEEGVIGPANHAGKREILKAQEEELA